MDKIIMQVVLLHLLLRMGAERHSIQLPSISLSSSSFLMQIILGIFIALLELVVFFNVLGQKVSSVSALLERSVQQGSLIILSFFLLCDVVSSGCLPNSWTMAVGGIL